jgi:hypothetical protein
VKGDDGADNYEVKWSKEKRGDDTADGYLWSGAKALKVSFEKAVDNLWANVAFRQKIETDYCIETLFFP